MQVQSKSLAGRGGVPEPGPQSLRRRRLAERHRQVYGIFSQGRKARRERPGPKA